MANEKVPESTAVVIGLDGLQEILAALKRGGYQVIGPMVRDEAIVYSEVSSVADLPAGWVDAQDAGTYRLSQEKESRALFDHVVGPHTWKNYLYPPRQKLFRATRKGKSFTVEEAQDEARYAFIGVRSCELAAMRIQDKVFDNGRHADTGYLARRKAAFVVAVNCGRAGGTCFCSSMNTGPKAKEGYDLALTEIVEKDRHIFVAESGSDRGDALLAEVGGIPATCEDIKSADRRVEEASKFMGRKMAKDVRELLNRNLRHERWDDIAKRCLGCANCTMVCPTCFCSTTVDVTDLDGAGAERWREWDSCFTMDFSHIHGGAIRRGAGERYRQWITHKLANWYEQFGSSGCTGCGRCITWCPVGIDITEEVAAIKKSEKEA